jgi:hypothetical protein
LHHATPIRAEHAGKLTAIDRPVSLPGNGRFCMRRKLLGICGVLAFGMFSGLSGALAGPTPAVQRTIEAETCNPCLVTCGHMYDMLKRDCANTRKYRTKTQQILCYAFAADEYGACLADRKYNKK